MSRGCRGFRGGTPVARVGNDSRRNDFHLSKEREALMHRSMVIPALLLALAACGGREAAEGPPNRVQVKGGSADREPAPVAVAGGDTAAPVDGPGSVPAASFEGAAPAGQAPATAPGSEARPSGPNPSEPSASAPAAAEGTKANQDQAASILRRAEQTATGIRSMEADFTQSLNVPLLGTSQRSTGKLYQRRPDRFAMRFTDPAGDVMVADGRHFWIYYPSNDRTQVIRTSVAAAGEQADFQQQFLSNSAQRYVPTLNGEESVGGEATWALTLVPRGESPYKVVRVWVDKDDFLVRRIEMREENDSVRRVELRNIRVNATIPDAVFTFTPPAGTQVFDQ
jgi:outer membrane lipoprotein carrier protein